MEPEELRSRLEAREEHLRNLYEELAALRLEADEAKAERDAIERELRSLRERRGSLFRRRDEETRDLRRKLARLEEENATLRSRLHKLESLLSTLTDPGKRIEAAASAFNGSREAAREVDAISKSFGRPEVRLTFGAGVPPPVVVSFRWAGLSCRTYEVLPEEGTVRLLSEGEELPEELLRENPNARLDGEWHLRLL